MYKIIYLGLIGFILSACYMVPSNEEEPVNTTLSQSEISRIDDMKLSALEKNLSGQSTKWSARNGGIKGLFTPKETFMKKDLLCRKTLDEIITNGQIRNKYEIYCKIESEWRKLPG